LIVYVETNFLLELAYLQERSDSCREILDLAKSRAIALAVPAFSAAEARATWQRRVAERRDFQNSLQKQVREISRSQPLRGLADQSHDVIRAFVADFQESRNRLESTIEEIQQVGTVIELTGEMISLAEHYEFAFSLSPQDALVLASVRSHAKNHPGSKCFVTQDVKGFSNPYIYDNLSSIGCKVLTNFKDALAYVKARSESG
jgi:predicted nucleic acid-binding protein